MKPETRSYYAGVVQRAVERIAASLDDALELERLAADAGQLTEMPERRVGTVRHIGPYNQIARAFERLGAIVGPAGLTNLDGAAMLAHIGPYDGLGDAWTRFLGEWLPASGHRLGTGVSFVILDDAVEHRDPALHRGAGRPIGARVPERRQQIAHVDDVRVLESGGDVAAGVRRAVVPRRTT